MNLAQNFRHALDSGTPQLGLCVMYPSPGAMERIAPDWDWMWLDAQHGQLDYNDVLALVRACAFVGKPAIPRVPGHEAGPIGKMLDTGAAGVIVPCVDTPEQAKALVQAAKFPPLGNRSYGARRIVDTLGRNYSDTANSDTLLIAQIESPEAIENAEAIAALPGIDALFLGPDDILLRRGLPVDAPRSPETLGPDLEALVRACRNHGKLAVTVAFGREMVTHCAALGYNMIISGGDVPFLANSSRQASADARGWLSENRVEESGAAPAVSSPY